jgi:hypothetical protein
MNEAGADIIVNLNKPEYLGDSIYYVFDGYQIKLYLDNGMGEHTTIYLDPNVVDKLSDKMLAIIALRKLKT